MDVDRIRDRIRRGDVLHMGFAGGMRVWWFEHPYEEIADTTMQTAARGHNGDMLLVEAFDSLFRWPGNSQTWLSAYG